MKIKKYKHPFRFYALAIGIPWTLWFIAGYISNLPQNNNQYVLSTSILSFLGLISPALIALYLIVQDKELEDDVFSRFLNFKTVKPYYFLITGFLMLASILLAQGISLIFGYSSSQFKLASSFSFSAGLFPAWLLLLVAPIVEELAWHSYGTDCLRSKLNLFTTSLIFAIFWGFWHFPLSFIKDYYQSNLIDNGMIYSLNFFVSLIPFVVIINWLYYKTERNIIVAIIFHITAGFFNEIFATHPMSKVIQTLLLLVLSIFLLIKEKDLFFRFS